MIKNIFSTCMLACLLMVAFTSCLKETTLTATYYGKVNVTLAKLPNTPNVDVYINGKKKDTLNTTYNSTTGLMLAAGDQQRLQIYKAQTDTLLADTLFNLHKDDELLYRFAYSEDLGIKGFLGDPQVGVDSVKIQLLYKANQTMYPSPVVDVVFFEYYPTPAPATFKENITIKGVAYNQLSQPFVLPRIRIPGTTTKYWFMYRLKDPVTGAYINQKNTTVLPYTTFMTSSGLYLGQYVIATLTDDGGSETANKFKANITIL